MLNRRRMTKRRAPRLYRGARWRVGRRGRVPPRCSTTPAFFVCGLERAGGGDSVNAGHRPGGGSDEDPDRYQEETGGTAVGAGPECGRRRGRQRRLAGATAAQGGRQTTARSSGGSAE